MLPSAAVPMVSMLCASLRRLVRRYSVCVSCSRSVACRALRFICAVSVLVKIAVNVMMAKVMR